MQLDCKISEKMRILTLNGARGTLTQKTRAKISKKGVKMGKFGFCMEFPIIWCRDMFSSMKTLREK